MNRMQAEQYLAKYQKKAAPALEKIFTVETQKAKEIGTIPSEVVKRFGQIAVRGKGIRGALVCLGFELAEGEGKTNIFQASLAMEIFHTALLVHDDIMDRGEKRRGLDALHKQLENQRITKKTPTNNPHLGEALAMCAGDEAFYLSWNQLLMADFPRTKIMQAAKIYTHYAKRVALGQMLDVTMAYRKSANEKQILKMMYRKSGEYTCEMPLAIGVALGKKMEKEASSALIKYAKSLGWLFQIQDDILGTFGREKETGKSNKSDITEGKKTLLRIYLNKLGSDKEKATQREIDKKRENPTEEMIEEYKNILISSGALKAIKSLAEKYSRNGERQIQHITNQKSQQMLLSSLLAFMIERTK